ncbi:MAG: sulfite exporter TauE/SafE family protein [Desulfocapsaceae bacterium]|nr:sulfite exporter TauE/SafE family protein [Desulfocapsaceae bacterium]
MMKTAAIKGERERGVAASLRTALFCRRPLFLALVVSFCTGVLPLDAHPLGGVLQKTVISNLTTSILIEYNTHIGPDVLLTLHPDTDFNGVLDDGEKAGFLERIHGLVVPNIICRLGTRELPLEEVDRKVVLEDAGDYTKGLNTQFVWRLSLPRGSQGVFSIRDNNFRSGELDQLSYAVNVMGETGPMHLADGGRELTVELSGSTAVSGGQQVAVAGIAGIKGQEEKSETETLKFALGSGSLGLRLMGFATALILGAFHALGPGHGKAMVAAYLVGAQGRIADAVKLGVIVTLTHVFSVLVLGALALIASHYTLSKDFFPWLGLASGTLICLTGYAMLVRRALAGEDHHHPHHHDCRPHGEASSPTLKEIFSLGIAGGLVPCPSALVILLFAIAVNRIPTGILVILSFSLGLASVLVLIGILTVTASRHVRGFRSTAGWIRRLPVFSAGIIMVLGLCIGTSALFQAGILTLHI